MKLRLRRIGAALVDLVICFAKAFVLSAIPAYLASGMRIGTSTVLIVSVIMAYLFFIIRDFGGRSIGKRLFSLKIVTWQGKPSGIFQRVRRNLTLVLFPIEFILIIAGYDTVGDNLGMTCVVDAKSTDVPGMKKGNNLVRLISLTVLFGAVGTVVLYYCVSFLILTGSPGYKTVEDYMQSSQIVSKYGEDIIWKVESYDKIDNSKYVYKVTVNADTFDITTVKINDSWFVYGVQSQTVEKLEKLIKEISDPDTERYALADIDADGTPELLEYFSDDLGAHISLYTLDSTEPVLTFDTKSHAGNARGDWRVYKDTDSRYTYALVGIYSLYDSETSEKYVYSVSKIDDKVTGILSFAEKVVSTEGMTTVDGVETPTVTYNGTYSYNNIEMPPSDYFYNYHAFFNKYRPVTDILVFEKWDAPESGENTALPLAINLVKKGWEHFELENK